MNNKQSVRNEQNTSSLNLNHINSKAKLLQMWNQFHVPHHYQVNYMRYLESLSTAEQYKALQQEIQLTKLKKSKHFVISKLLANRITLIQKLSSNLDHLQYMGEEGQIPQGELQQVSITLKLLRNQNYEIYEEVVDMLEKYNMTDEVSCRQYVQLFKQYDKDFIYLKRTILFNYIPFLEEFDPFLLEPTKIIQAAYQSSSVIQNTYIKKLLTLSPSQMFKLLKAKNKIINLISRYSDKQETSLLISNNEKQKKKTKQLQPIQHFKFHKGQTEQVKSNKKWKINNQVYLDSSSNNISTPSSKMKKTSIKTKLSYINDYTIKIPSSQSVNQYSLIHQNKRKLRYISSIFKVDISQNRKSQQDSSRVNKQQQNNRVKYTLNRQAYNQSFLPKIKSYSQQDNKKDNVIRRISIQNSRQYTQNEDQCFNDYSYYKGKLYPIYYKINKVLNRQKINLLTQEQKLKQTNIKNYLFELKERRKEILSQINEKYKILAQQQKQQALHELNIKANVNNLYRNR